MYFLFGRHILFPVFMSITLETVYTCVSCPWSVTSDSLNYSTFVSHICSFASMIPCLSFPCLAVISFLQMPIKFLLLIHKDFTFGSHICSFTSVTTYVFFVWQTYFFFLIYVKIFWNCTYMYIYTKYSCTWSVTFASHICSFTSMMPLVFHVCQSYLCFTIHKHCTFASHIFLNVMYLCDGNVTYGNYITMT